MEMLTIQSSIRHETDKEDLPTGKLIGHVAVNGEKFDVEDLSGGTSETELVLDALRKYFERGDEIQNKVNEATKLTLKKTNTEPSTQPVRPPIVSSSKAR